MMDNRYLGGTFGGFAHEGGTSFPALTSDDNTATAYENTKSSNQLSIHKDSAAKNKRVSKIIGGGLRQFSIIVCKKIERKGRTTCSEVADEIVADFTRINNSSAVSFNESDEKNIRRRVYDALNVLMALDIIAKDKKAIWWKGLQNTDVKDFEQLKALHVKLINGIGKKSAYLKELEEQIAGLQNLMSRNQQLIKSGYVPSGGFSLPFILVRTSPHATVEIEISEDMQLVHFDFNSTPFSLHDDAYILKLLRCYQLAESRHVSQNSSVHSSSSSEIACGGTRPFYWNSEIETRR
ncbi:transcription factor-like protein DPA [Cornus florida]|uniref:transcription factor-like protein DPA n=1 Tax=Cornus florida TaxID=4283 RepID=UPI00289E33AA|nr:transcription factor-like protein DPA [Cornus florida]XP_059647020.1 transcription factor-like protein DPA [Cornus florida]